MNTENQNRTLRTEPTACVACGYRLGAASDWGYRLLPCRTIAAFHKCCDPRRLTMSAKGKMRR